MAPAEGARTLVALLWAAFFLYWWLASKTANARVETERGAIATAHLALFGGAFLLALLPVFAIGPLAAPLFGGPTTLAIPVLVLGLAFAAWARQRLGRHWSGEVAINRDHELIRTGPYAIVRHPIYTGTLVALLGHALFLGEVRGWLALGLALAACALKIPREERWLDAQFGDAWREYRARVRAVVPWIV